MSIEALDAILPDLCDECYVKVDAAIAASQPAEAAALPWKRSAKRWRRISRRVMADTVRIERAVRDAGLNVALVTRAERTA